MTKTEYWKTSELQCKYYLLVPWCPEKPIEKNKLVLQETICGMLPKEPMKNSVFSKNEIGSEILGVSATPTFLTEPIFNRAFLTEPLFSNSIKKRMKLIRFFVGAEDEIRTRDPRLGKAMLYPWATSAHKLKLVEGDGFEPSKAQLTDLQSAPFGHSGIPRYFAASLTVVSAIYHTISFSKVYLGYFPNLVILFI